MTEKQFRGPPSPVFKKRFSRRQITRRPFNFVRNFETQAEFQNQIVEQVGKRGQIISTPIHHHAENENISITDIVRQSPVPVIIVQSEKGKDPSENVETAQRENAQNIGLTPRRSQRPREQSNSFLSRRQYPTEKVNFTYRVPDEHYIGSKSNSNIDQEVSFIEEENNTVCKKKNASSKSPRSGKKQIKQPGEKRKRTAPNTSSSKKARSRHPDSPHMAAPDIAKTPAQSKDSESSRNAQENRIDSQSASKMHTTKAKNQRKRGKHTGKVETLASTSRAVDCNIQSKTVALIHASGDKNIEQAHISTGTFLERIVSHLQNKESGSYVGITKKGKSKNQTNIEMPEPSVRVLEPQNAVKVTKKKGVKKDVAYISTQRPVSKRQTRSTRQNLDSDTMDCRTNVKKGKNVRPAMGTSSILQKDNDRPSQFSNRSLQPGADEVQLSETSEKRVQAEDKLNKPVNKNLSPDRTHDPDTLLMEIQNSSDLPRRLLEACSRTFADSEQDTDSMSGKHSHKTSRKFADSVPPPEMSKNVSDETLSKSSRQRGKRKREEILGRFETLSKKSKQANLCEPHLPISSSLLLSDRRNASGFKKSAHPLKRTTKDLFSNKAVTKTRASKSQPVFIEAAPSTATKTQSQNSSALGSQSPNKFFTQSRSTERESMPASKHGRSATKQKSQRRMASKTVYDDETFGEKDLSKCSQDRHTASANQAENNAEQIRKQQRLILSQEDAEECIRTHSVTELDIVLEKMEELEMEILETGGISRTSQSAVQKAFKFVRKQLKLMMSQLTETKKLTTAIKKIKSQIRILNEESRENYQIKCALLKEIQNLKNKGVDADLVRIDTWLKDFQAFRQLCRRHSP